MRKHNNGGGRKYGKEHQEAKEEKRIRRWSDEEKSCEVTGKKVHYYNEHHNVPKFFNGPDEAANYITLDEQFHRYLHYVCNVTRSKLVGQRIQLTNQIQKHILDDEKVAELMRTVHNIDAELIPEYIHNMMYNMPKEFVGPLVEQSLIHCFQTIRDMRIRILQLTSKQEQSDS